MQHHFPQCHHDLIRMPREFVTNPLVAELQDVLIELQNGPREPKKPMVSKLIEFVHHGIDYRDYLKKEGFWCQPEEKDNPFKKLPFPTSGSSDPEGLKIFIERLRKVEAKLKPQHYMGYSKCRICGKLNGTGTYFTNEYAWPTGYMHYLEEHQVQPSAGFIFYIMNFK